MADALLDEILRKVLSGEMASEQRPEGSEGVSHEDT